MNEIDIKDVSPEVVVTILEDYKKKVQKKEEELLKEQAEKEKLKKELENKQREAEALFDVGGTPVESVKDVKSIAELAKVDPIMAEYLQYLLEKNQAERFLNTIFARIRPQMEKLKEDLKNEQVDENGEVLITSIVDMKDNFFNKYNDETKIDEEFPKNLRETNGKFFKFMRMFERWQNYAVDMLNLGDCMVHSVLLARKSLVPSSSLVIEATEQESQKEINELKGKLDEYAKTVKSLEKRIDVLSQVSAKEIAEEAKDEDLAVIAEVKETVDEEPDISTELPIPPEEDEHSTRRRGRRRA